MGTTSKQLKLAAQMIMVAAEILEAEGNPIIKVVMDDVNKPEDKPKKATLAKETTEKPEQKTGELHKTVGGNISEDKPEKPKAKKSNITIREMKGDAKEAARLEAAIKKTTKADTGNTFDALKKQVISLAKAGHKDTIKEHFKNEYGVQKLSDIPEEKHADVREFLSNLLV